MIRRLARDQPSNADDAVTDGYRTSRTTGQQPAKNLSWHVI